MTNKQIIETYKNRLMTIREIARKTDRSYESVRRVLVEVGYHNGKATQ